MQSESDSTGSMEGIGEPNLLQTLRGHRGEVTCADAFGARLVSGAGDRTLRLWRWEGGGGWAERAVARAAHRYGVTAARWSPGGALVGSAGVDGAVRVWCGRSLRARRTLAAPSAAAVRALCWASGARLVAGHDDGALCVWHVPRAVMLARLAAHEGALHAVATPAHSALLLTACTEGVLKVFDLIEVCRAGTSGAAARAVAPLAWVDGAHDLGALCADAAGDACATSGHDARIHLWRAARDTTWTLQAAGTLEGHAATVTALRWAGGGGAGGAGPVLASASLDRTARLWLPHTGACARVLQAHSRYLTCIALAYDLTYLITGSNDKSLKMWSLGMLSIDDELEIPCSALSHFALGDLEGIGPVDAEEVECGAEEGADENGSRRVWHDPAAHTGPINCISVCGDLFATASSDGQVKIFRWSGGDGEGVGAGAGAVLQHALAAHEYPALACDLGAGGALLLTAGLDTAATVWDVQMGCTLRTLAVPSGGGAGGEGGGGGVRGARVSPHRPPLLLLATDDGLAPLWTLTDTDPHPVHVYAVGGTGAAEAATCAAWASDGRVLCTGAAGGELAVHSPPPAALTLHLEPHAHDLGVQSCDFAPNGSVAGAAEAGSYILATAGADSLIKLWIVDFDEETIEASVRCKRQVEAHGGGVACVRWGAGGLLASAGGDPWARVWRVSDGGDSIVAVVSVPAGGAGGAPAVALLTCAAGERDAGDAEDVTLLAVGTMAGELALWRLPAAADAPDDDDGEPPRFWDEAGVARWLREYVTRAPGVPRWVSAELEAGLVGRARAAGLTGARLLDDTLEDLLASFGFDGEAEEPEGEKPSEAEEGMAEARRRLHDELVWLRRHPPPPGLESVAPHALLCPVSHRLVREPARAADGFTYERGAVREGLLAAAGASPATGRRLPNARLHPNYRLRDQLRAFLDNH